MREPNWAQRLESAQERESHMAPWAHDSNSIAQSSRLPIRDTELSETDIRYSVRFKSRPAKAERAARPRSPNYSSSGTRASAKKTARPADKFYLAYALLIGLLAGLAIPSVVVLAAVLIINPSAIGAIFSQLLLAVMAIG